MPETAGWDPGSCGRLWGDAKTRSENQEGIPAAGVRMAEALLMPAYGCLVFQVWSSLCFGIPHL